MFLYDDDDASVQYYIMKKSLNLMCQYTQSFSFYFSAFALLEQIVSSLFTLISIGIGLSFKSYVFSLEVRFLTDLDLIISGEIDAKVPIK